MQFTPDLLPSDVIGASVFDPREQRVRVPPRAGVRQRGARRRDQPRAAEDPVGAARGDGGARHRRRRDRIAVPSPFLVIATQNPIDFDGTYPLPEAQLDRFLVQISLGYPDAEHEIEVLRPGSTAGRIDDVRPISTPDEIAAVSASLATLHVADPILRYVREIGVAIRHDERVRLGASTRGLRALVRCLQVYAAARGRHYVIPADVHQLVGPVLAHRTVLTRDAVLTGHTQSSVVSEVLETVAPPQPDQA